MLMSRFINVPSLKVSSSPGKWELDGEMRYASDLVGHLIVIPKGFVTDLASIPRLARLIIPVNGRHRLAAIVHDYLYARKGLLSIVVRMSRKQADQVFLEALKVQGVGWWKRQLMYTAVRAGGWAYWNKKAK